MNQKLIDLILSIIASLAAIALSWPYLRDFQYWAESETAWLVYFGLGFVLCTFVFYVFMVSIHTLFSHAELERDASNDKPGGQS